MSIDWGVIAQIIAILGGFSAFLLWLVRMVIKQMLADFRDNTVEAVADNIKEWAMDKFPSKASFEQHAALDTANHGELGRVINLLVRDQAKDHERLRVAENSITRIKFKVGLEDEA